MTAHSPFPAPPLAARLVQLRPLVPEDYPSLYEISVSEQLSFNWRFRGNTPSFEAFVQGINQNVLCQFVVSPRADRSVLGLVACYASDLRNGFAFLAVAMHGSAIATGAGMEAMALLVNYVFDTWAFRKLYFEASEFVYPLYASGEGRLFEREGTMRGHWYFASRYWDEHLLAIYREQRDANIALFVPELNEGGASPDPKRRST